MFKFLKDFSPKENNNLYYYARALLKAAVPRFLYERNLKGKLAQVSEYDMEYLRARVDYYNKLRRNNTFAIEPPSIRELRLPERQRAYYIDSVEFTRFFNKRYKANFLFGDITHVPESPSFVKSRPVNGENVNSVLLKLNKRRHFRFVNDEIVFRAKKDMLVWRGVARVEHRIRFLVRYFNNEFCDIGKINRDGGYSELIKPVLSIKQHLNYKFILCIEGNDVATNLKWVMSSNSIAVMPRPKYETWFMEGTLQPDYHYILIKDDFSDLDEKLQYYIDNPDKAEEIIGNAHNYVDQFRNKGREDLLCLLVLEKYFVCTGQMVQVSDLKTL